MHPCVMSLEALTSSVSDLGEEPPHQIHLQPDPFPAMDVASSG